MSQFDRALVHFARAEEAVSAVTDVSRAPLEMQPSVTMLEELCSQGDNLKAIRKGYSVCKQQLLSTLGKGSMLVPDDLQIARSYPRTVHLPFSPNVFQHDICMHKSACSYLISEPVVVMEKMDGGNCCIFRYQTIVLCTHVSTVQICILKILTS